MRRYVFLVLPLLLAFALIPSSLAQGCEGFGSNFYCKAYTDKPFYNPGDTGKLTIDLKNLNSYTIKVNNLTIMFPWAAYVNGQWDGNSTVALPNKNITSYQWMDEQMVSFTVPNDGRFPSAIFGLSSGTVTVHFFAYTGGSGAYRTTEIPFSVTPNSFIISTGWSAISNYLLYTDILLGALVVLFVVYIIRAKPRGPALPHA